MNKNDVFSGSLEALRLNQQRPGLDPNKSFINKEAKPKTDISPEQEKAESMLGKVKVIEKEKRVIVEGCDSTTNYEQFKHLDVNRPVDKAHVKNLINAIKKKNLLHLNPITVNRNMEIIDGQHRLAAAKQMKIPVYFIVDDKVSQDDIAGMNSVKKNWQLIDYLNFYANKGVNEYVRFMKVCEQYPEYQVTMLLQICNSEGKRGAKDVVAGLLDIGNIGHVDDILSKIEFFKKHFHLARSSRFIEAFLFILHSKEPYDHERMVQKVELNPFLLVPSADKKGYIRMLQSVYNRGVREDNIVTFLKR